MDQGSAARGIRSLAGPAFGPAAGGDADRLMVVLHGVGADGADLIGLAPYFAQVVPGARILAPDGPEPCDMAPVGRQWFSLQDRDPAALYAELERVRPDVDAFIDENLSRLDLAPDRLILAGFSQGAMTALHVGLRRTPGPAAILSFSGALVGRNRLAREIRCHPPVFIVHGEDDTVVPVQSARDAERTLLADGVDVQAHVLPGLGHGIDERALGLAARFLGRVAGPR